MSMSQQKNQIEFVFILWEFNSREASRNEFESLMNKNIQRIWDNHKIIIEDSPFSIKKL